MRNDDITLITDPTVICIAESRLNVKGLNELIGWVADNRPECVDEADKPDPDETGRFSVGVSSAPPDSFGTIFPHAGYEPEQNRQLTDAEMLVELAGRNCYMSYGKRAGRKSNALYLANTQSGDIPHASIMYHAQMTFFVGGVSRRLSHELIRHYVGAQRDEEGSPSQESTRYTYHPGHFVVHPGLAQQGLAAQRNFEIQMRRGYSAYRDFVDSAIMRFKDKHGTYPKGMDRKRIYEVAAGLLPQQAATSFIWTSNPVALMKMFRERTHPAADAEFQRLARLWKFLCENRWPNLFAEYA